MKIENMPDSQLKREREATQAQILTSMENFDGASTEERFTIQQDLRTFHARVYNIDAEIQERLKATTGTHVGFNFAPTQTERTFEGRTYTDHKIGVFNGDTLIGDFNKRSDLTIETQVEWAVEEHITRSMRNGEFDNESLVGMFVSKRLWSDVNCVGKVVGTFGKTGIIVEPWDGVEQTTKMEFIPGGFSAHCPTNWAQKWRFEKVEGDNKRMRLGKGFWKDGYRMTFGPTKHYDFNF